MGSRKLELVDCQCTLRVTLLLSSVLESRNLKMKVVLLLFAMIVVAFGQEADEGWEETPPADPPVEESKYKTDKYGKKPYGYKPKYDHKPKYGYQPPKPYGYQPPKPYGGYGYNKKPVYGGYGNYGPKPTDTKHLTVTKGHLTDTRNLDMVKSPTVTNPNTEKSLRRTKIGKNRKKRPMKMAIGRTTLTKIGKNKNIAKIKKSFSYRLLSHFKIMHFRFKKACNFYG